MERYISVFGEAFMGYYRYLIALITNPNWTNFFYWLIGLSVLVWFLEIIIPWRKNQPIVRKDFWLDTFYMFFNFFLFSLLGWAAVWKVFTVAFNDLLKIFGYSNIIAIEIQSWPVWLQLMTLLVLRDFIHWNIHRMLHRVPLFWQFHKIHHSVKQMGFAAHLRFHWMESVIYRTLEYIPLAMIGFGLDSFFVAYLFALAVGHINHANVGWDYGPLKYVFNNPKMHIWHHARHLPAERRYGVNFGLTFSFWDYLFGTSYVPGDGGNEELGFEGDETFPRAITHQLVYPLGKKVSHERTVS